MSSLYVIVGLGVTGFSCARYLKAQGIPFAVTDSRVSPPQLAEFQQSYPDVQVALGQLDNQLLNKATKIILSPGISRFDPHISLQAKRGIEIIGDIELFAQAVQKPVIAITGTNAKSTVTTLVGKMAEKAGVKVAVGGNLGTAALDLLSPATELYVLELSSFHGEDYH